MSDWFPCPPSHTARVLALLDRMTRKRSNLVLAADVTTIDALLDLIRKVGPHVAVIKTHLDILTDLTPDWIPALKQAAQDADCMLFEDRKFADIGHTTQLQFTQGTTQIAEWADFVTVHSLPGPGILEAMRDACHAHQCGLLLLASMSAPAP